MRLGRVVGTVVATQKSEGLTGSKLLVVQAVEVDGKPAEEFTVAVDTVGAGAGEVVLVVHGSSARLTDKTRDLPVDGAIVAIVDSIESGGKVVYRKEEDHG
jgi:microcompartment protein CcmK/EutM